MGIMGIGQIINPQTGDLLADVYPDHIEIHAPLFLNNLKLSGIAIPPGLKEFGQRRVVHYRESDFPKAFLEVYFPHVLKKQGYELRRT